MKTLAICILFAFFCNAAYLQNPGKVKVEHERNKWGAVTKIIYKNSETSEIVKEISLGDTELNPYRNLDYPRLEHDQYTQVYDVSNENKYDLFDKYLSKTDYPRGSIEKLVFDKAIVSPDVYTTEAYRYVWFNLWFINDENCLVGQIVSLVILDTTGNVFKKIDNSVYGIGSGPQLTSDGRFLSYRTNGCEDVWCPNALPCNVAVIYDFEIDETILVEKNTSDYYIGEPFLKEQFKYFVIKFYLQKEDGYQYNIIFPHDRIIYKKIFTESERENILRYENNGIVLRDSTKGELLVPFDISFRKSDF